MNILRRIGKETLRELGLNVPTIFAVFLGAVIWFIVAAILSVPEFDSIKGFVLWVLQPIAAPTALAVAFVLFFGWNVLKVTRWDRSALAHLELTNKSIALMDDQMKAFLNNTLKNPVYGVARLFVFGSVVALHPTRDVDIIIQFNSSKPNEVRTRRDRLRNIESLFQEFYGLQLHVQMFLSSQNEALSKFLNVAGAHEQII